MLDPDHIEKIKKFVSQIYFLRDAKKIMSTQILFVSCDTIYIDEIIFL